VEDSADCLERKYRGEKSRIQVVLVGVWSLHPKQ